MEYLTEMFTCLRSTGGNLAVALGCFLLFALMASVANDRLSVWLIALLLFCAAVWRVIVWIGDFASCF